MHKESGENNISNCCYFKYLYIQVFFGILIVITHYLVELENLKILNYNEKNFECYNKGCCKIYDQCDYLNNNYTIHYIDIEEGDNCLSLQDLIYYYKSNNYYDEKCLNNYDCDNNIRNNISKINVTQKDNFNCISNKNIIKYYQIEIYANNIFNYKIFILFCILMFFMSSLIIICEKYNNYSIVEDEYP